MVTFVGLYINYWKTWNLLFHTRPTRLLMSLRMKKYAGGGENSRERFQTVKNREERVICLGPKNLVHSRCCFAAAASVAWSFHFWETKSQMSKKHSNFQIRNSVLGKNSYSNAKKNIPQKTGKKLLDFLLLFFLCVVFYVHNTSFIK